MPSDSITRDELDQSLLPGEPIIASLSTGGGEFHLTATRVSFTGGRESETVHSSAMLRDVTGVEMLRRPRESRSAWWGGIGLLAAIGVWEVSSNNTIGGIAAVVVALISIALLADYWFRPGGVVLAFRAAGSSVQGTIESSGIDAARQFIDIFEASRASARLGSSWPTAGYGSF